MSARADAAQFAWLARRYVLPSWRGVLGLVALSALATALTAALPLALAPILDLALGTPPAPARETADGLSLKTVGAAALRWLGLAEVADRYRAIALLCLVYGGLGLLKGLADFGAYLQALAIQARGAAAMRADLMRHLLGLSMSFFTRQRTGELVSRLTTDTQGATSGLETVITRVLTAPLLLAFYGYLMVRTSPKLVVAAVAAGALHWVVTRLIRGPVRRLAADQYSVFGDLAARLQEAVLSVRVVKSFGAEGFELRRIREALARALRVTVKFGVFKHVEEPARTFLNYAIEAAIIGLAAWELLAGQLTAAAFFLFLYVGRAVMTQLGVLASAVTDLQAILGAASRVGQLFAEAPAVADGPRDIDAFRDRLAVRGVSFAYAGEPVLSDVSFEVARGEMVALVGPSGAGKSTLADLLLRLHDPQVGSIEIDGRDLRTLRQERYRRLFGVVSQEALLFNASVRENIAYGRDGLTEADIVRAARIANAHDFVLELPQGYDTVVGDRGIRLSGGQRQRVAIARAIAANPPLIVLDEATSALDSESERLVQEAIDRVVSGTTTIVIAHRLSTVRHADKIVVLRGGRVEAMGRHAELLTTSETYTRLHRLQLGEPAAIP